MIKRIVKGGDEMDVHSKLSRRLLCYLSRAGAAKKVKTRTNRRERREGNLELNAQLSEYKDEM